MDALLEKKLADLRLELLSEVRAHACKCQEAQLEEPDLPKEKTPEDLRLEKLAEAKRLAHERKLARERAKKEAKNKSK